MRACLFLLVAPTPITHGAIAYGFIVPFPEPLLPAENTTLTPASVSIFVATFTGSLESKTVFAEKLQFTTRTLYCRSFFEKIIKSRKDVHQV